MHKKIFPFLLSTMLIDSGNIVFAETADRNKPMEIAAEKMQHEGLEQISVFSGAVDAKKGTIVLRGARLVARKDPEGYQYAVMTAEAGKRAFFRQKRDTAPGQPDEFIEGEGEIIEYDGKGDIVKFIRRGELRRYRGGRLSDEITGSIIVYNNLTDVFTVDGQKTSGGLPSSTVGRGGRVRAVLAPKSMVPSAQPREAASGAPQLQSSEHLESLSSNK